NKCSDEDVVLWVYRLQAFLRLTGVILQNPKKPLIQSSRYKQPPASSFEFMGSGLFDVHWK
ncbi:hypothetical protein OFB62_26045, partial [Escherichia coli]|nr:hypothetical protein [Escherichia coli]